MLTDSENSIKLCKHCIKVFVTNRPGNESEEREWI